MRRLWTALVVGVVLPQAFTPAAHAQTNASNTESADTTRAQPEKIQTEKVQEVVVTGSRIKRESGFDYPVPVAVLSGDDIRESGYTAIGDALANLPQSLATTGIQNTSGSLFNAGQSRANLRGLGTQRTLVLVDGRRHVTGDFQTSAVDLNVIPSSMVERIEAISGGASAVYGSEAIAGVINIILRKDLDGLLLDVGGGQTQKNDGGEWSASAGYGFKFASDRAHFLIGAEFGKTDPIMRVDRDWAFPGVRRNTSLTPQPIVPASRSNTMPTATFELLNNTKNPSLSRSASVALDYSSVFSNSALCSTATVNSLCQDPGLFYASSYDALQGGVKRATARSYLGFDLTDNLTLFADISYAHIEGDGIFQPAFSNAAGGGLLPVALHGDNAYLNGTSPLDAELRGFWQGAGLPFTQAATANVGKFWQEFGDRDTLSVRENYRAVSGVQGKFDWLGRKADYEVYGQYGELDGYSIGYNVPNIQRTLQETDAVVLNGKIVCRSATARAAGCQPWDLINGPTPAAVSWANANARANGMANQSIAAATLSTSLFDLPAGPLGVAAGVEYRNETSDQVQDPLSAAGALFYNAIGRTQGKYHVTEGYAEIAVPLLKDLPFAKQLTFEAAGRLGSYSTVGHTNQWRLAMEWAPVSDLRFRASEADAVRAPNIAELYAPQGQNFTTAANDPCDKDQISLIAGDAARHANRVAHCAAAIPGYNPATFVSNFGTGRPSLQLLQGGNPILNSEVARTYTAGFVVQPHWFKGLEFSTDYWQINVDGAISTIPINTLLQNLCYDATQTSTPNKFCGLVHRDPAGNVTFVELTNQNVQGLRTSGLDTSLSYRFDAESFGLYQFRVDGTKIIRWDLQGVPNGPTTHYAGVLTGVNSATPRYKINTGLGWDLQKFALEWQAHWYSSMAVSETLDPSSLTPFYTGSYWEHDFHATYRASDSLSFRAGAINVTNVHPPIIPEVGAATGTTTSVYDNRGRWFFLGGNYRMQ